MNMESVEPSVFFGNNNTYMDIATRGNDHLALSLNYVVAPQTDTACIMIRFLCWNPGSPKEIGSFNYLGIREVAEFKIDEDHKFQAARVFKAAFPVFQPSVSLAAFLKYCAEMSIWDFIADWLIERCKDEGFTPDHPDQLKIQIQGLIEGKYDQNTQVSLVLQLPTFKEMFHAEPDNQES